MFKIACHNHGSFENYLEWTIGPFSSREKACAYFEAMKANKVDDFGRLTYCHEWHSGLLLDPVLAWDGKIIEVELDPVFDVDAPGTKNYLRDRQAREERKYRERYNITEVYDTNRLL